MIVWCIILLGEVLVLVLGVRLLAVFRARSAHTSTIAPLNRWSLPVFEFVECLQWEYELKYCCSGDLTTAPPLEITFGKPSLNEDATKENEHSSIHSQEVRFSSIQSHLTSTSSSSSSELMYGFESFRYIEISNCELLPLLESAASKCILLHGLYLTLYQGSLANLSLTSSSLATWLSDIKYYTLACTVPNAPWLGKKEIYSRWNSYIVTYLATLGYFESNKELCNRSQSVVNKVQVFGHNSSDYIYLTKEVMRGEAAPTNGHQGGRDPLPLSEAHRRPLSGLLKTFAIKNLPFPKISNTIMEPELGFLMTSFLRINTSKDANFTLLDPFCGSCSLLAYASHRNVRTTIGIDSSPLNISHIQSNFRALNCTSPVNIYQANAIELSDIDASKSVYEIPIHVDGIITDPPYGMQEK